MGKAPGPWDLPRAPGPQHTARQRRTGADTLGAPRNKVDSGNTFCWARAAKRGGRLLS